MSHHPARRARTVTALLSAGAFAAIAGGLASTHPATSAPATPTSTPATTVPAGPPFSPAPDDTGWTTTPATPGSLSHHGPDHGQSGAS